MGFFKKLLTGKIDQAVKKVEKDSVGTKVKVAKEAAPAILREEKITEGMVTKGKINTKKKQTTSVGLAQRVLLYPLVTEKSAIAESENKYSFITVDWATKEQIKKAITELYGVEPVSVNVVNYDGRHVSFRGRQGKRKNYKKAMVTLQSGKTIDIHKGV